MDSFRDVFQIAGWVGAVVIVVCFMMTNSGRLTNKRIFYSLNLLGAISIIVSSTMLGALQPAAINLVWAGESLFRLATHKKANHTRM